MDTIRKGEYIFPVMETIEQNSLEALKKAINTVIKKQEVKYFVSRIIEISINTEAKTTKVKYVGIDESGDDRVLFLPLENENLKEKMKVLAHLSKL